MASRLLAVAIVLALLSSCSPQRAVRLDTGQGAPREYMPPTWNKSVGVDADELERALAQLAPEARFSLRSPQHGWLVRASFPDGSADPRWKNWHHIVEQTEGNVQRFGPHAIHNTQNVIPLEQSLHTRVSAFYPSIRERITGSTSLTVRQWLSTQSYESQRQFGLKAIEKIRSGEWQ
jgi:hypothetical protein